MNRIQQKIVVALFFSVFGGAWNTTIHALQSGSNATAADQGSAPAAAFPAVGPNTLGSLPPIVSKESTRRNSIPPIVSSPGGGPIDSTLPPIVTSTKGTPSPTQGRPGELDTWANSRATSTNREASTQPLNSLRPLEPSQPLESRSRRTVDGETPANDTDPSMAFPRTSPPNQMQMPSYSRSGVPFYSTGAPLTSNSWQDEAAQIPQSVLSNGVIVSPGDTNAINGMAPVFNNGNVADAIGNGSTYFDSAPMVANGMSFGSDFIDDYDIESRMGYFGAMSRARRYLEIDMLYLTRVGDSITLTNFGGVGSFDWRLGWRGTLGTRFDETSGREISYFGTEDITATQTRFDPAGRLSALFFPSDVYAGGEADAFFNAQAQSELMRTRVHSLEFNRVNWAWDVAKSFFGIRYFNVDDLYQLDSISGADVGTYRLRAKNNLIGLHIGREWFYDVGYRLSFSGLAKGGIYGNATRFRATATSNGTNFLNGASNRGIFSTNLEFMFTGHYQINNRARLRAGYQALVLDRMVTVEDNLSGSLNPFLGSGKANKDTMFFHGFNVGLELYR